MKSITMEFKQATQPNTIIQIVRERIQNNIPIITIRIHQEGAIATPAHWLTFTCNGLELLNGLTSIVDLGEVII